MAWAEGSASTLLSSESSRQFLGFGQHASAQIPQSSQSLLKSSSTFTKPICTSGSTQNDLVHRLNEKTEKEIYLVDLATFKLQKGEEKNPKAQLTQSIELLPNLDLLKNPRKNNKQSLKGLNTKAKGIEK